MCLLLAGALALAHLWVWEEDGSEDDEAQQGVVHEGRLPNCPGVGQEGAGWGRQGR